MTNEAEKMAREYSEPREWAEDHYEHWEDIDPVEAAEDGYRAGYLAGQQSLWIPVSDYYPDRTGQYFVLLGGHRPDVWRWDASRPDASKRGWFEATHWMPITLPATKEEPNEKAK